MVVRGRRILSKYKERKMSGPGAHPAATPPAPWLHSQYYLTNYTNNNVMKEGEGCVQPSYPALLPHHAYLPVVPAVEDTETEEGEYFHALRVKHPPPPQKKKKKK